MTSKALISSIKDADNRKIVTMVIVALLIGLMVYVLLSLQAAAEETISLSNGKQVHLGQSRQSVVKELGSSLRPVQNYYAYVNSSTKEVEALIYFYKQHVSAVRVSANSSNIQKLSGVHVGASAKAIEASKKAKVDNINPALDRFKFAGYRYIERRAVIYMLTDRCRPSDSVISWVLAFKGQESLGLGRVKIAKCNVGA